MHQIPNSNISHLILQLPLTNPLKSGVKSRMRIQLEWSTSLLPTKMWLILEVWWYVFTMTITLAWDQKVKYPILDCGNHEYYRISRMKCWWKYAELSTCKLIYSTHLSCREAFLEEMGVSLTEEGDTVGVFSPKKVTKDIFNSLAPGRCCKYFQSVISEHILRIKFMSTCEIALR